MGPIVGVRCVVQDFVSLKAEFDKVLKENAEYERCLKESHLGLIHKYASIGDDIYRPSVSNQTLWSNETLCVQ